MPLPNEVTTGTVLDANGEVANKPTVILTVEEAELLRRYKKFLSAHGLREALYCNNCWDVGNIHDGCNAFVTDSQIGIICRCKMRFHQGQTF